MLQQVLLTVVVLPQHAKLFDLLLVVTRELLLCTTQTQRLTTTMEHTFAQGQTCIYS